MILIETVLHSKNLYSSTSDLILSILFHDCWQRITLQLLKIYKYSRNVAFLLTNRTIPVNLLKYVLCISSFMPVFYIIFLLHRLPCSSSLEAIGISMDSSCLHSLCSLTAFLETLTLYKLFGFDFVNTCEHLVLLRNLFQFG